MQRYEAEHLLRFGVLSGREIRSFLTTDH